MEWIKFGDKKPEINTLILFIHQDKANVGWYEGGMGDDDCYWLEIPVHPKTTGNPGDQKPEEN